MDKAARDEYNRQYYAKNKAKIDAKQSAKEECKHCGRSVRHENIWKHMKTDYLILYLMTDKVRNWMESMPKQFKPIKKDDPTFPSHMIKPSSMIVTIGPTGSGKTNSVVEFLHRKDGRFFEIIIYTGSSSDEPYYNYLASAIDGLQLIDNVGDLPNIDNYKQSDSKDLEKLIVFDDSVMSDEKVLKQIAKWFMCARKVGFTCMFLAQDYVSTPKFIRRNAHYLQLFKLADQDDVGRILRKHATDTDVRTLRNMMNECTREKGNFLTIAVNDRAETKYRQNFTGILDPDEF
eukprot:gene11735-13181_t